MAVSSYTQSLMDRLRELLPLTEDEIIQRGIAEAAMARIIELRQRQHLLSSQYGSINLLEEKIRTAGVPANDHTLYTDLLEWRAVRYEIVQLTGFLEDV